MALTLIDIQHTHCTRCGVEKPPQFRWAVCPCCQRDEAEVKLPAFRPRRPLPRPAATVDRRGRLNDRGLFRWTCGFDVTCPQP
jgi:hypothetical protein